jgi:hypothetical protein
VRGNWPAQTRNTGESGGVLNDEQCLSVLTLYERFCELENTNEEGKDYFDLWMELDMGRVNKTWVSANDLQRTLTRRVINSIDRLFQESLAILRDAWSLDETVKEDLERRIKAGDFDPSLDFVNDPKMTNAVGQCLIYLADLKRMPKEERREWAKENIHDATADVSKHITDRIARGIAWFVEDMSKNSGLRPVDINAVSARLRFDWNTGEPIVDYDVDQDQINANDLASKEEEKKQTNNGFDSYMHG